MEKITLSSKSPEYNPEGVSYSIILATEVFAFLKSLYFMNINFVWPNVTSRRYTSFRFQHLVHSFFHLREQYTNQKWVYKFKNYRKTNLRIHTNTD